MKRKLIKFILGALLVFGVCFTTKTVVAGDKDIVKKEISEMVDSLPASVKLYVTILKYSELNNIPANIPLGMAYYESGYRGPQHLQYVPAQTSKHRAYGPMQVKLATANGVSDTTITKKTLLNDIETNVSVSLKYLALLKKQYGTWARALGAYHTGSPVVDKYATLIRKFDPEKKFKWNPSNKG